jgi:sigma-E factor negative regulatory protein RseB
MPAPLLALRRWLMLAACAALLPPALAAAADAPAAPALSRADAEAWLMRLNVAATERNYRGTMVFAAQGVVSSSRVAHVGVGQDVYERVEALDGHLHRVYRHNDTVHTVWPNRKVVVVEQRAASPGLVSTRRRVDPRALDHYTLRALGPAHVAGRTARQVLLQPADDWRFAQRLWADEASGLLLRADVLAPDGRVLESSAFSEVELDTRGDGARLLDGMTPAGYEVLPARRESVDWPAQGWTLKAPPPGFELVGCVRRPAPAQAGDALQAVFSDGLSFVSLFIEPYRDSQHTGALSAELGAMHTVMQRVGDHWITAMGDVPRVTLEQFIRALERRP